MNRLDEEILEKIAHYNHNDNGLGQTSKEILAWGDDHHPGIKYHLQRVALLAEAIAKKRGKDDQTCRIYFFAGLLHDAGKFVLPCHLFNGKSITYKEWILIQEHPRAGFEILNEREHPYCALCAGLHHNTYENGYGIDVCNDFSPNTADEILHTSTIISICDFIDAFNCRNKFIKNEVDRVSTILEEKHPGYQTIVELALHLYCVLNF